MRAEDLALRRVIDVFERRSVSYMVTGSVASSYHGRPRATHDANIVIDPSPSQFAVLIDDLEATGFYVPADGARAALQARRQFNAIDTEHGFKIDPILRKDRAYSHEEFSRRRAVTLYGHDASMVTAEDAILSKLEWATRGESEKQLRDAASVLELNPSVDRAYIEHWASELGVLHLWQKLLE